MEKHNNTKTKRHSDGIKNYFVSVFYYIRRNIYTTIFAVVNYVVCTLKLPHLATLNVGVLTLKHGSFGIRTTDLQNQKPSRPNNLATYTPQHSTPAPIFAITFSAYNFSHSLIKV